MVDRAPGHHRRLTAFHAFHEVVPEPSPVRISRPRTQGPASATANENASWRVGGALRTATAQPPVAVGGRVRGVDVGHRVRWWRLSAPAASADPTRTRCAVPSRPLERGREVHTRVLQGRRRPAENSVDLAGIVVATDVRPPPSALPCPRHLRERRVSTARGRALVGAHGQIVWPPTFELLVTPGLLRSRGHLGRLHAV